jgi:type VI secretion system protein ImpB
MGVKLKFESMDDFDPAKIVEQVPALKTLLDSRDQLRDLLTQMDTSEDLESLMEQVLSDTAKVQEAAGQMGVDSNDNEEGGE